LIPDLAGSGNKGAIIFIDELDAVGTKRFDSEVSGDREVQPARNNISHISSHFVYLGEFTK
jgi:ATP-dependent 26S proteasome regulatory subunit